jgi:hypothetical protein
VYPLGFQSFADSDEWHLSNRLLEAVLDRPQNEERQDEERQER